MWRKQKGDTPERRGLEKRATTSKYFSPVRFSAGGINLISTLVAFLGERHSRNCKRVRGKRPEGGHSRPDM